MRLSAELFADFAASLECTPPTTKQHERRRASRVNVSASVPVTLVEGAADAPGQTVLAKVKDFSPRGVNVLFPCELTIGQQFVLTLKRSDGVSISILCTVLHSHEISPQLYRIGAEFTCVLHDLPVTGSRATPIEHDIEDKQAERIQKSLLD